MRFSSFMLIFSLKCRSMGYDGIVLEVWNAWAASGILDNPILRQKVRYAHFFAMYLEIIYEGKDKHGNIYGKQARGRGRDGDTFGICQFLLLVTKECYYLYFHP